LPIRRILIVDDDDSVRELLAELFRWEGYHVTTAPSAGAALEVLRREVVDLLVTDYMMPTLSGAKLIETIRAENPDVLIVMMSAFPEAFDALDPALQSSTMFLAKPFGADEALGLVASALSRRPRNSALASDE